MKKLKYKVGDKVRVRKDLDEHTYYSMKHNSCISNSVTSEMYALRGHIVEIEDINERIEQYKVRGSFDVHWTDEMFEGLHNRIIRRNK